LRFFKKKTLDDAELPLQVCKENFWPILNGRGVRSFDAKIKFAFRLGAARANGDGRTIFKKQNTTSAFGKSIGASPFSLLVTLLI
jgi:hypothetical protein